MRVDLSGNNVTEVGAKSIAFYEELYNLRMLDLRRNRLGNEGFEILTQMTGYPELTDLKLSHNQITEDGIKELVTKCSINGLTKLRL
jgi:Ran GTPase-activating protein (RanGAP) involved in mRNA processing and transport